MEFAIFLERSNKYFSKLIELLKKEPEVRLRDVKKTVSHSSYYALILNKIYFINKFMRDINPNLFLAEPHFEVTQNKTVFTALRRCELIEIETREQYFILRVKNEKSKMPSN